MAQQGATEGWSSGSYGLLAGAGVLAGIASAFTGLGGGFLMVPMLLAAGFSAQRAVGTSLFAILIIATSSIVAHHRLANVDWRVGIALGVGGVLGAQVGARLVEHVSTATFKKIFAALLAALAVWLFVQK